MDIKQLRELEAKDRNATGLEAKPHSAIYESALRNAAPYLFAVVEAAEGLEDHQDFMCQCHLFKQADHKCPVCVVLAALSDFRNAK